MKIIFVKITFYVKKILKNCKNKRKQELHKMPKDAREACLSLVWRSLFLHEPGANCDPCVGGSLFGVGSRKHSHQSMNCGLISHTKESRAFLLYVLTFFQVFTKSTYYFYNPRSNCIFKSQKNFQVNAADCSIPLTHHKMDPN